MKWFIFAGVIMGSLFVGIQECSGYACPLIEMELVQGFGGTHVGADYDADAGDHVYALADGRVCFYKSDASCMGGGNGKDCDCVDGEVIFVRHQKPSGTYFIAMYGHIKNVPSEFAAITQYTESGPIVEAGEQIAEIGVYAPCRDCSPRCDHLHLGIWDSENQMPSSGWGYGNACYKNPSGCWVAPESFLGTCTDPQVLTFLTSFVDFTVQEEGPYFPNQVIHCTMRWKNEGSATWSSTPGDNYVELGSCNINQNIVPSWLYDSSLGWISNLVPCTFDGDDVGPGETATFAFPGKIPSDAQAGQTPVYFGAVYDAAIMEEWEGNGITLTIVETQPAPENTPDVVRLRPDGEGGCDFRVAASDGDDAYDYGSWLAIDWMPDTWFVADVHNDGLDDLVLVRGDDIYVSKSYDDHFRDSPLLWKSNWGNPSGTYGYLPWMYYGDSRVDLIHYRAVSATQVRWWGLKSMDTYYSDLGVLVSNAGNQSDYFFSVGSFHGQRREDIIFGRRLSGSNQLHYRVSEQITDGSFQDNGWWDGNFGFYYSRILVADIDGDDYDDLVGVTHQGSDVMRVTWGRNTHSESFTYGSLLSSDFGNGDSQYFIADVDQDGHDDLIYVGGNGNIYWARTYHDGSAWRLSSRNTWINYFAQGSADEFRFGNVTDQIPSGQGRFTPENPGVSLKEVATTTQPGVSRLQLSASPNPTNLSTVIAYALPQAGQVNLSVYNVAGRLVKTLVDCRQPAGEYSVTWDSKQEDFGIYFCRLSLGNDLSSRKIVLLK